MATSTDKSEAVKVKVNVLEDEYTLSFVVDGVTKYFDIIYDGRYVSLCISETPGMFKYNTEYKTFIKNVNDEDFFIGTYNNYSTLSASSMEYISTSFPAHIYEIS